MKSTQEGLGLRFVGWNALISVGALAFLTWLILRPAAETSAGADWTRVLPTLNAGLNTTAAALLCLGWAAIRRGAKALHRNLMLAAFACSALFLIGYVVYHYFHGDTVYAGPARSLYLLILASHILLSIAVVPLCLTAFFTAYREMWSLHARINRLTLPIWLYVSVTGVVVYLFLHALAPAT